MRVAMVVASLVLIYFERAAECYPLLVSYRLQVIIDFLSVALAAGENTYARVMIASEPSPFLINSAPSLFNALLIF